MPLSRTQFRTLAHPLRSQLYAELRGRGHATATELAQALGTNTGATSYHLRVMAEAELINEEETPGRRRVWHIPDESDAGGDTEELDDETRATMEWLEDDVFGHFTEKYAAWLRARPEWPARWQEALDGVDGPLIVTADQLGALQQELADVLEKYRRIGQGNPGARRVAAYVHTYPIDLDRPPLR